MKGKTMRTSKPARASARPAAEATFWERLAEFPERYRDDRRERRAQWEKEWAEEKAETWEQSIRRQIRELRAALRSGPPEPATSGHTRRFWKWFHEGHGGRRAFIYFDHVTDLVDVSKGELLKATAGQPFRLDFGRDNIVFMKVAFEEWIRAQARQAVAA